MTISMYIVSFRNYDYVRKSVNSFLRTASEPINVTIVDNPCDWPNSGTDKIRKYLRRLAKQGIIRRAMFFEENCIGWALCQALKDFKPDDSETFFCMSDGDLIVPEGCDWIKEIRKARAEGCVVTGAQLSIENYKAPCVGFSQNDENFGMWLMSLDKELFFKHHTADNNVIDYRIMCMFRQFGEVRKLRSIELYHCAWDIFKPREEGGDPEYAEYKSRLGSGWVYQERNRNLRYELVEK